ncbi:protein DEFECTIVE IN EXINE FORMATION 1 [Aplysia californica]|uniref:Protein DEFECTIVE IN EXINE FORMATION 1 n=1 Tax=Aplysia californica TaxID=6500 RepID=A0ABM0JGG6_APLCA|nr:protein DEFECTIVE IN EXINE FORMATION 1 [Aplysia californica]
MLVTEAILYLSSLVIFFALSNGDEGIASKNQANKLQRKRCPYKLRRLWQNDISSFPFAAPPLVVDVDGDGGLDVVAAPFGEALTVIEGETGKHLHDTSWPQHNLDRSVHSSPLQYDVDGDGLLDLLFVTSQAEGLFYTGKGQSLHQFTFQLQPAYVKSNWFSEISSVDHRVIHQYVTSKYQSQLVPVDAHVLSTPVLHEMRFLILPVSYFFSPDDYDLTEAGGPWGKIDTRDKYFVTALVVLDLKKLALTKMLGEDHGQSPEFYTNTIYLELKQNASHLLFSPVVADIDGTSSAPEIVIGTSTGNVYAVSLDGKHRKGFPKSLGPLSGKITAANMNVKPGLEIIAVETNGRVHSLDGGNGEILWTTEIRGSVFAGSRVVDVDVDGQLDIVVASDEGDVYALHGLDGSVLPNYPFKTGKRINGNVLVTKFNLLTGPFDLVFVSDDGLLHVLSSDHSCYFSMSLGDSSLVDILSHDVVLMNRGIEFLVATSDGSLICLGSGVETPVDELYEMEFRVNWLRLASPSDSDSSFVMHKTVVIIEERTRRLKEVTGSSFDLYCTIFTESKETFDMKVYMGSELVNERAKVTGSSNPLVLRIQTPEQPGQAQLTVVISDKNGFTSSDAVFLKFNQLILLDLQWLVLAPFIAMVIILLVNHGFPAKDLLPVTFPTKSK